jgi:indoleacetamide hydrolase
VRVPAALCGVVGFRPSAGRYPSEGIVPISPTLDTPGLIVRCVDDARLLDEVIAGVAQAREGPTADHPERAGAANLAAQAIRLGWDPARATAAAPSVQRAVAEALEMLRRHGVQIVSVDLSDVDAGRRTALAGLPEAEFPGAMGAYLSRFAPQVSLEDLVSRIASPAVRELTAARVRGPAATFDFAGALTRRAAVQAEYARLCAGAEIDAIVQPTAPEQALPRAGDDRVLMAGAAVSSWLYFRFTAFASTLALPAISLPIARSATTLPVGIELIGRTGGDRALLSVAATVEHALSR